MIHIIHEDSLDSCTTKFWRFLIEQCVGSTIKFDVQGMCGRKNVKSFICDKRFNDIDAYIVFYDYTFDNYKIIKDYKIMQESLAQYGVKNVYLAKLICFEYLLLTFEELEDVVRPFKINSSFNELCKCRRDFIEIVQNRRAQQLLLSDNIKEYIVRHNLGEGVTSEQFATELIKRMSDANKSADFRVRKNTLGNCWTCDCCSKQYGKCYINNYGNITNFTNRYSKSEKASRLIDETILYDILIDAAKFFRDNGINIKNKTK